jgi:hypothetical protein
MGQIPNRRARAFFPSPTPTSGLKVESQCREISRLVTRVPAIQQISHRAKRTTMIWRCNHVPNRNSFRSDLAHIVMRPVNMFLIINVRGKIVAAKKLLLCRFGRR